MRRGSEQLSAVGGCLGSTRRRQMKASTSLWLLGWRGSRWGCWGRGWLPPSELQCCGEMPAHSGKPQSTGLSLAHPQTTPARGQGVLESLQRAGLLASKATLGARGSNPITPLEQRGMAQQPCSVQGGLQSLKGAHFSKAEAFEMALSWKSKEPPAQLTQSPVCSLQRQADTRHHSSPQMQDFQGMHHGKR